MMASTKGGREEGREGGRERGREGGREETRDQKEGEKHNRAHPLHLERACSDCPGEQLVPQAYSK